MKSINILLISLLSILSFSCANVILKNTQTNTVHTARLNDLYELGDTVFYDDVKLEIVRKKLSNGNVTRKEPYVKTIKESTPVIPVVPVVPTPTVKEPVKEIKKP
jgi:hypothetical protein